MSYILRYEELLNEQKIKYLRIGDMLLREYNSIIIPLGPILRKKPTVDINAGSVFKGLKGYLVWWAYFDEDSTATQWYGVLKFKHIELSEYRSANTRNQIRKGLKNCDIRRIKCAELIEKGYAVYSEAVKAYGNFIMGKNEFDAKLYATKSFDDIIHYWGIYNNKTLIGYAVVYVYDTIEANISEIRINPAYNKVYPSYALLHILSEEYIKVRFFRCLSDGYRNMQHATNIQQLLIKKFGFEKVGLCLRLNIRFPLNIIINILYPIRKLIKNSSLTAVFKLVNIYRKGKTQGNRF